MTDPQYRLPPREHARGPCDQRGGTVQRLTVQPTAETLRPAAMVPRRGAKESGHEMRRAAQSGGHGAAGHWQEHLCNASACAVRRADGRVTARQALRSQAAPVLRVGHPPTDRLSVNPALCHWTGKAAACSYTTRTLGPSVRAGRRPAASSAAVQASCRLRPARQLRCLRRAELAHGDNQMPKARADRAAGWPGHCEASAAQSGGTRAAGRSSAH